jgi:cardiolipin synthase A/B
VSLLGVLSLLAAAVLAALFLLVLFEPSLPYHTEEPAAAADSPSFVNYLSALVNARLFSLGEARVLAEGRAIYDAQLTAIRGATRAIHLEVYLFLRGRVGDAFLAALEERARAGVAVRLIVDRIGSLRTPDAYFARLRAAGGRVLWYQPIAWYTLKRFNNRTHRDILVVDAEVGFVGGVGVADWWIDTGIPGSPWRDTTLRVTGDFVKGLQTSFAENWLEASGEILPLEAFPVETKDEPAVLPPGSGVGMVVDSSPSAGRSTRARVLFQVLLASARHSIEIASPYFLPDRSLTKELLRAVRRGVTVRVLVPGAWNNHPITRLASRRRYGALLGGGVRVFEYQPSMMHAKVLVVDGLWSVLGSTNFDSRSFGLNDEVNVAILEPDLAARLQADFEADLLSARPMTLDEWRRRRLLEKLAAPVARLLERQV